MNQERYLLVGLGNPGRKYRHNRHNVGFMVIDRLARRHTIDLSRAQFQAVIGGGRIMQRPVILAKPQLYMNRSGDAVGPLANYYRVEPTNTFVIYDEIDLPLGTIRLREQGGSGGHNGMRSIINHIGPAFPRLRLGIGRPPGRMEPADYVLQDFGKPELEIVDAMLAEAVAATETFLKDGVELAMTRHNGTVQAT